MTKGKGDQFATGQQDTCANDGILCRESGQDEHAGTTYKGFAAADAALELPGTLLALQHDDDFFGGLSLFVENRLSLASKALLLAVVSPLPLRDQRVFPLLVLRHLVRHVHVALAAVSPHLLWEADHGQ